MVDIFTKQQRSKIMSKIGSKNTKIELLLRRKLWARGLRYRNNYSRILGKPDVAFVKDRILVFVDSCFWHGCFFHGKIPATNRSFWLNKINANKNRDKKTNAKLKKLGYTIIRVWEHQLTPGNINKVVSLIANKVLLKRKKDVKKQ